MRNKREEIQAAEIIDNLNGEKAPDGTYELLAPHAGGGYILELETPGSLTYVNLNLENPCELTGGSCVEIIYRKLSPKEDTWFRAHITEDNTIVDGSIMVGGEEGSREGTRAEFEGAIGDAQRAINAFEPLRQKTQPKG